ncbi:hypothetical protein acsn021_36160 [Anaerocolumna cellulosilytica]|uniref:DUF1980 domain-containing protein n=1 Tax=Anaerocolumna cellulosilytica TaxID=433286 RepID=A0A6S6R7N2_9FIRM|nr:TIGR03943 family protein [Anaerocolumna cellulosilytica]MBB5195116.1 putative membrane protein [Anaerocolumna cellulosilytica]BCJ96047.1 hypothetical protein acsn021_36160 [Anaerocolumna cellulosilytica]
MRRKKNAEVIVQFIILIAMAVLLAMGMITGKVKYYVHPRYHWGIWLSIGVLFVFAFSVLGELKKARHNVNLKQYLIYVLPVFIVLLFPVQGVTQRVGNAQVNVFGGNQITGTAGYGKTDLALDEAPESNDNTGSFDSTESLNEYTEDTGEDVINTLEDSVSQDTSLYDTSDLQAVNTYDDMSEKYAGEVLDGATIIKDDYFASWYYDTFDYLEDFIGKRYQFTAQVFYLEGLRENQFLAGRYVMVCCAADVSGFGLICETDRIKELKEEEWIQVTGTIKEGTYNGSKVPVLTDVEITGIEAPADEYVYYNFY